VITIMLSAADATAHIIENPFVPRWTHHPIAMTGVLVIALGAIFLKGFKEAIGLAVLLVALFLVVNVVVVGYEIFELWTHPSALGQWRLNLEAERGPNPMFWLLAGMLLFPKLALGLSGFETGVAVMPLVSGTGASDAEILQSRIRNTRKLLTCAAAIMSVMLIGSAVVTATMIPAEALRVGGEAYGRALAYLAHRDLGIVFGTVYDVVTIGTLWFAGASAMAGLLNLVPQYLPRYGMAPDWAGATRPLVLIITGIALLVTFVFDADVNAQGGAYATGVLMLMTSAAIAVAIALPRRRYIYVPIALIFIYTTVVNMVERPEGLQIAGWFIVTIIASSLISRVLRSTEIRIEGVDYDEAAGRFISEAIDRRAVRIIASRPNTGLPAEYARKLADAQAAHNLQPTDAVMFLEVRPGDASDFSDVLHVTGVDVGGYRVLRATSPAIPNAIAGLLLDLRDRTDTVPHVYFGWTEGNPIAYLMKFLAFGEGDTAPVTREVLRKAEPEPHRRPRVHVG
jgi:hypothetical protein